MSGCPKDAATRSGGWWSRITDVFDSPPTPQPPLLLPPVQPPSAPRAASSDAPRSSNARTAAAWFVDDGKPERAGAT